MPRQQRLVVPPAPLCSLRPHRLLRLIAEPARERSCQSERPHSHKKFRARRGLVLRLRNRRRHGRSSVSAARAPSDRAADAGSCRQGAARLAAPPPLTGDIGVTRGGPRPPKALLAPEPQQVRRFTGCDPIPSRGGHVDFCIAAFSRLTRSGSTSARSRVAMTSGPSQPPGGGHIPRGSRPLLLSRLAGATRAHRSRRIEPVAHSGVRVLHLP